VKVGSRILVGTSGKSPQVDSIFSTGPDKNSPAQGKRTGSIEWKDFRLSLTLTLTNDSHVVCSVENLPDSL